MDFPKLEIINILKQDTREIFSSRDKSIVLHKTKNIDASGDEVENAVRRVIERKLPNKYYVSQGHIVDENLQTSNQFDIIIADNSGSPVLFKSENRTEYFPYESIYSFGEIKSTFYSSKNYIKTFIDSTKNIYEKLKRRDTPTNQLSQDISLSGGQGISFMSSDKRQYKNPIFKFMFFVNSNDFSIKQIRDLYNQTQDKFLPNLICFLDKGIIVKAQILKDDSHQLGPIELSPEFITDEQKKEFEWVFIEFGDKEDPSPSNFAFLIFALNQHLRKCLVLRPELLNYYDRMFQYRCGQIVK